MSARQRVNAGPFGYQSDGDIPFQQVGHRWLDPTTGRFLTRDPIKDGRNWYGYGAGLQAPTTGADPSGEALLIILLLSPTAREIAYEAGKTTVLAGAEAMDPTGLYDGSANRGRPGYMGSYYSWVVFDTVNPWGPGKYKRGAQVVSNIVQTTKWISTRRLRKQWEEANYQPWPREANGDNYVAHHIVPLADSGINDVSNIEPMTRADHIAHHVANGDYQRWGGIRYG